MLALSPCPPSIYIPGPCKCLGTCILLCPKVGLDRYCSSPWCGRELHVPGSPSTSLPPLCRSRWETRDIQMLSLCCTRLSDTFLHKLSCALQYPDSKSGKLSLESKLISNLWFWDQKENKNNSQIITTVNEALLWDRWLFISLCVPIVRKKLEREESSRHTVWKHPMKMHQSSIPNTEKFFFLSHHHLFHRCAWLSTI